MAVLGSPEQSGHALVVLRLKVRLRLDHDASNTIMTVLAREHERCEALVLLGLEVGVRLDQFESDLLKAKTGLALACSSDRVGRVLALRLEWGD